MVRDDCNIEWLLTFAAVFMSRLHIGFIRLEDHEGQKGKSRAGCFVCSEEFGRSLLLKILNGGG